MAEEQSIKDQIAAMYGWAIRAREKAGSGSYKEAIGHLGNNPEGLIAINTQGRRLEWRGGKFGLKHLPELEEVEALKRKVTEARAAAQRAQSSIEHLLKLAGKDRTEGKKPEEIAAIQKKEKIRQKETAGNISILIQVLKEAAGIVNSEPWINPEVFSRAGSRPELKKLLIMLLTGSGYYRHFSQEERREVIKKIWVPNINLDEADLAEADLYFISFENASLKRAKLRGARFTGPNFKKADLSGADLSEIDTRNYGADFAGATLNHADFSGAKAYSCNFYGAKLNRAVFVKALVSGSNFTNAELFGADFRGADFGTRVRLKDANLEEVNLKDVKNLTKEQLCSAKKWSATKNRPRELW